MDQKPSLHCNKSPKQSNTKPYKKQLEPLKVVYFSNPIRVTTSVAGFRGVVQELTGQDSDVAEILSRQTPASYPGQACDSLIYTQRPPPVIDEVEGDNSLKLMAEKFGGADDYFDGLLPLSLLFDME